jgi:hypothetical protein
MQPAGPVVPDHAVVIRADTHCHPVDDILGHFPDVLALGLARTLAEGRRLKPCYQYCEEAEPEADRPAPPNHTLSRGFGHFAFVSLSASFAPTCSRPRPVTQVSKSYAARSGLP